ncbi:SH3 domain-containing protein [Paenibacillus sacheonensis]|uniref:SH3 domain-containing protein n=1 Tax=Paenibacillus sacheonensis TaxID=742054 RepID=A0A7X4YT81_9BACL|nr:SH3 domain-containing protein [Paenibacillus sacheonensis]MBM7568433.1 lysozyme family protein/SH3-like domain-containing protein [Paenibacillus sacheonensis]NBC72131.1 SH3 domain-containing protein [Paenibacillus sacheonensis]
MRKALKIMLAGMVVISALPVLQGKTAEAAAAPICPGMSVMSDPLALSMEAGSTVIWDGVTPALLEAKKKYEQLLSERGWKITYNSAYRPFEYQRHLKEIVSAPLNACKSGEKAKHALGTEVAAANYEAPHTKGIAFDASVTDEKGNALNGMTFVSPLLTEVAARAGLGFTLQSTDGVHHELMLVVGSNPPAPGQQSLPEKKIGTGLVVTTSGNLNIRSQASAVGAIVGSASRGSSVNVYGIEGDWYLIQTGSVAGYVSKDYLKYVPATPISDSPKEPSLPAAKIGTGTVVTQSANLNIRSQPSTDGTVVARVRTGVSLDVYKSEQAWYLVKTGAIVGYASKDYVKFVPAATATPSPPPTKTPPTKTPPAKTPESGGQTQPGLPDAKIGTGLIVTQSGAINVRSQASAGGAVISSVNKGATVDVYKIAGDWYLIRSGSVTGYVSKAYVRVVTLASAPPASTSAIKLASQATFAKIYRFTMEKEGLLTNKSYDSGAKTNRGITQSEYSQYLKKKGLRDKSVAQIQDAEAYDIYYNAYWLAVGADRMSEKLAIVMFDTLVNMGYGSSGDTGGAVKFLQQALGVKADGDWGAATESAFLKQPLEKHDALARQVLQSRLDYRYARVKQDIAQQKFLAGWINRDYALRAFVGLK